MGETTYELRVPSHYLHENAGREKPLLIFLHGYTDNGPSFLRRAYPEPDPRFELLAPNGPFPLPQRSGEEWREAFAWYFADFDKKAVLIHPDVAAGAVATMVESLGLAERPKILCGFSQGGYFMPFLAAKLRGVQRLITIGAGFRPSDFTLLGLRLPVFAIHGDADEVIPFSVAQSTHQSLGAANRGGSFEAVRGMNHAINEAGREALRRLLATSAL